jgi:hypothetical protein
VCIRIRSLRSKSSLRRAAILSVATQLRNHTRAKQSRVRRPPVNPRRSKIRPPPADQDSLTDCIGTMSNPGTDHYLPAESESAHQLPTGKPSIPAPEEKSSAEVDVTHPAAPPGGASDHDSPTAGAENLVAPSPDARSSGDADSPSHGPRIRQNNFHSQDSKMIAAADVALSRFFPAIRPERANYLVNFSPSRRYLYVETPKVACTSIKKYLQEIELDESLTPDRNIHDRNISPLAAPYDSITDFLLCLYDPNTIRFSFVRNPFTRVLSCYLDKIVESEFERKRLIPELALPRHRIPSFKEFLIAVKQQDTWSMDIHWLPQDAILSGLSEPYFIGRLENFNADFSKVISLITGQTVLDLPRQAPHETGSKQRVLEMIGREERDLIIEIYDCDFRRFSYSTDPKFC